MANQIERVKTSQSSAESVTTKLTLRGLSINVQASFQREIILNAGTEQEQVLPGDHPSTQESIHIDAASDEAWLALTNSTQKVTDLVLLAVAKADEYKINTAVESKVAVKK